MRTLNSLFNDCVEKYRDNVYLLENSGDGYKPTTYLETRIQVHRFAAGLISLGIKKGDVLIGIASSGTTPYVIAGLKYAKQIGCRTAFIICNPVLFESEKLDVIISVDLGPEIITGSTRMKAGTATKLILNMISTTTMVKMGKVYGNLMVDLQVWNEKLRDRGTRIIENLTDLNYKEAGMVLKKSGGSVKTALIMVRRSCSKKKAKELIKKHDGNLRKIIGDISI